MLTSLLASLLAVEIGYRLVAGLPVLKLANWRTEQIVKVNLGELKAVPDPILGWTNKASSYNEDGYSTIEYGVRKNFEERSEEHTSELQSLRHLVCRLLLEKKKNTKESAPATI